MFDRRQLLGASTFIAAVSAVSGAVFAQGPDHGAMPGMAAGNMTREGCIEICLKSHRMCLETARYCTEMGGAHVGAAHLALLLDCAEMCQTTANSLLRFSPEHGVICGACAQLCEACAKDCDAIAGDDRMARCAATCRECAQDCRGMVNMKL
jgi:hypothetical protein